MAVQINASNNIFVYKLIADNGGAPCIHKGVLSLSICKPRIRQSANVGDWIIGFGGKSVADLKGRLIYIAQVTEVLENGAYYASESYYPRPDCIYRKVAGGYIGVENDFHDPVDDLPHDLGAAPQYDRARNLLSTQFVYFGGNPEVSIAEVADLYENLPRDFVKSHPEETRLRWEQFIRSVIEQHGLGAKGKPTHGSGATKCYLSEDEPQVYKGCGSS